MLDRTDPFGIDHGQVHLDLLGAGLRLPNPLPSCPVRVLKESGRSLPKSAAPSMAANGIAGL